MTSQLDFEDLAHSGYCSHITDVIQTSETLRYNAPDNGTKESIKLKEIVSDLKTFIPKMKIQHSSGAEIKSACGQFL